MAHADPEKQATYKNSIILPMTIDLMCGLWVRSVLSKVALLAGCWFLQRFPILFSRIIPPERESTTLALFASETESSSTVGRMKASMEKRSFPFSRSWVESVVMPGTMLRLSLTRWNITMPACIANGGKRAKDLWPWSSCRLTALNEPNRKGLEIDSSHGYPWQVFFETGVGALVSRKCIQPLAHCK